MSENIGNKIEQVNSVPKAEPVLEPVLENKQEDLAEQSPILKKIESDNNDNLEMKAGSISSAATKSPIVVDDYHQRREVQIDAFLSEGLEESFLAMPPVKQKEFKEEGEKTVKKINLLLDATVVNVVKIVNLIKRWLKMITGINKFFLDQEAKIKADKIIKIKDKM
jgi:hypothetical protein